MRKEREQDKRVKEEIERGINGEILEWKRVRRH